MEDATLSIGEVAERAGTSISAIRFYEREGLLPAAERVSGQRRFRARARAATGARRPQAAGGRRPDRACAGDARLADDGERLRL